MLQGFLCQTLARCGGPQYSHFLMWSWLVGTVGSDLVFRSCGNGNEACAILHRPQATQRPPQECTRCVAWVRGDQRPSLQERGLRGSF